MMMRVGEAMDCTFFYGFLPNGTFDSIVDRQAERVARDRIARIDRTMLLEGQQLPKEEVRRILEREARRLAEQTPRTLWNLIENGRDD
jgi:hypothetical protein